MDEFAELAPLVTLVHNQDMVAVGNQIVRNIGCWPVTIIRTPPVNQCFYQAPVCQHYGCSGSQLQREYAAISLSPFSEPWSLISANEIPRIARLLLEMGSTLWKLVEITN